MAEYLLLVSESEDGNRLSNLLFYLKVDDEMPISEESVLASSLFSTSLSSKFILSKSRPKLSA